MQVAPDNGPTPNTAVSTPANKKQRTASATAENRHKKGSAPSTIATALSITHRAHKAHQVAADLQRCRSSLPTAKLSSADLSVPTSLERLNAISRLFDLGCSIPAQSKLHVYAVALILCVVNIGLFWVLNLARVEGCVSFVFQLGVISVMLLQTKGWC